MAAISAGEFERIFKEFYKPLCLCAHRFTEKTQDAVDVVQQGPNRLAQHVHLRPALKPLCALVPVDDAVLQIAHDDGVLGLVEQ